jgi:hypothetical protein
MPRGPRRHIVDGQFAAVIRDFMSPGNARWQDYAQATREVWGREPVLVQAGPLGALSVYELRPSLIQRHLDGLAALPGKQEAAFGALRALEKWALVRDRLPGPITLGCDILGTSGGHLPWTDAQIAHAEHHARPKIARVITLAAGTGQRGSDLVRMRWQDIESYRGRIGINVTQRKTGRILWVPFSDEFQRAIEEWERRPGHILTGAKGKPWGREWMSNAWTDERDNNPALTEHKEKRLVLHGLRGSFVLRLRRANVDKQLIGAAAGMSAAMVDRYCRLAEQRDDAIAAVDAAERGTVVDLASRRETKA